MACHLKLEEDSLKIIEILCNHRFEASEAPLIDVNAQDRGGNCALNHAALTQKLKVCKYLIEELDSIIWEAKRTLLIMSPYIKLDDHFTTKLSKRIVQTPDLHVIIIFGKNENEVHKSLREKAFEYLATFPNIPDKR